MGVSGFHALSALDWGRRDQRRVVICAHGYSGNARDFDFLAEALGRHARVVCPDVAGRGESAWLASPLEYHFGQYVADMRTLIAEIGAAEVDWVGTSMGGLLGMLLASQPSSPIRRLVMNDVGAFLPIEALQAIARNLAAPASFATIEEVEAHIRHTHREWGPVTDAQWRHMAIHGSRPLEAGGYRLNFDPRIARVAQPIPLTPGLFFWDAWYRVRCPVLLVRGERSEVFPRHVADTMLDIKPSAELVEIADYGHVPALMSPDQIAIVRGFLEAPERARNRRSRGAVSAAARHEPRQRFHPSRTS